MIIWGISHETSSIVGILTLDNKDKYSVQLFWVDYVWLEVTEDCMNGNMRLME